MRVNGEAVTRETRYQWGTSRRYNSYADWLTALFGGRVQKLSINGGFTCPNRDGTLGTGGCTYCNNEAFIPSYCKPEISITQQIREGIEFHRRRYRRVTSYIAYFQAYTNTYADIGSLAGLYAEALDHPSVIGVVIGTRPDCVDEDLLEMLAEMAHHSFVSVEYGIESVNDETLRRVNRGHDFATAARAVHETAARGINVGAHLIFGLPGEGRQEIAMSAEKISKLPLTSLKIRQLQLIRGTRMADQYRSTPGQFDLYSPGEYLDLVVSFIERLKPEVMIDRISGEAPPAMLDDPREWMIRSSTMAEMFAERLQKRDTWQGKLWKNS